MESSRPTNSENQNNLSLLLLELLTTEPLTNYCNAVIDLNNILEEIGKQNDIQKQRNNQLMLLQLESKIRRLRTVTKELRNHLSKLECMAETTSTSTTTSSILAIDIREYAERTRRAVASVVVQSSAGYSCFHHNGLPVPKEHGSDDTTNAVNVNLIAISTVKASIMRLKEKIKESS